LIKFTTMGDRSTLIGLGITEENVRRLKEGDPIFIKGKELGFDWLEIIIFYGQDEDRLTKMIKELASIDVFIDKRG